MTDGPKDGFAFIIDTDSYAGNFEREMTAYLTGVIGECGVGDEMVEKFDIDFESVIQQVSDDHGCHRPTTCWPEPNSGSYNSVAIFFYERPTEEHIIFLKERIKYFNHAYKTMGRMAEFRTKAPDIKILGFRLIEFKSTQKEIKI